MIEFCICKHDINDHYQAPLKGMFMCGRCSFNRIYHPKHKDTCWCYNFRHNFKLDNLQLVEDLAKERNLI